MNVPQMKKFLKKNKTIKVSSKTRQKIERVHNQNAEDVLVNLRNPVNLIAVEPQPSRRPNDESHALCFQKNKRKILFVVITYKRMKKKTYLITAFTSTKKLNKLIKIPKIVRR